MPPIHPSPLGVHSIPCTILEQRLPAPGCGGIKLWFYQGLGSPDAEPLGPLVHAWLQVTYSMLQELSWKLSQLRGHVLFTVMEGMKKVVVGAALPQAGLTEVLSLRPIWHTCIHSAPVL